MVYLQYLTTQSSFFSKHFFAIKKYFLGLGLSGFSSSTQFESFFLQNEYCTTNTAKIIFFYIFDRLSSTQYTYIIFFYIQKKVCLNSLNPVISVNLFGPFLLVMYILVIMPGFCNAVGIRHFPNECRRHSACRRHWNYAIKSQLFYNNSYILLAIIS